MRVYKGSFNEEYSYCDILQSIVEKIMQAHGDELVRPMYLLVEFMARICETLNKQSSRKSPFTEAACIKKIIDACFQNQKVSIDKLKEKLRIILPHVGRSVALDRLFHPLDPLIGKICQIILDFSEMEAPPANFNCTDKIDWSESKIIQDAIALREQVLLVNNHNSPFSYAILDFFNNHEKTIHEKINYCSAQLSIANIVLFYLDYKKTHPKVDIISLIQNDCHHFNICDRSSRRILIEISNQMGLREFQEKKRSYFFSVEFYQPFGENPEFKFNVFLRDNEGVDQIKILFLFIQHKEKLSVQYVIAHFLSDLLNNQIPINFIVDPLQLTKLFEDLQGLLFKTYADVRSDLNQFCKNEVHVISLFKARFSLQVCRAGLNYQHFALPGYPSMRDVRVDALYRSLSYQCLLACRVVYYTALRDIAAEASQGFFNGWILYKANVQLRTANEALQHSMSLPTLPQSNERAYSFTLQ